MENRVHDINHKVNDDYYRVCICKPPRAEGVVVCSYGTMEDVLHAKICSGVPEGKVWSDEDQQHLVKLKHIGQDEMWMTENPGSQGSKSDEILLTGSFNPIKASQEDWEQGAYEKAKK